MDNEFWQLVGQLIIIITVIGGILTGLVIAELLVDNHRMKRVNERIDFVSKMRPKEDDDA